jgi:N utilization substance protein A
MNYELTEALAQLVREKSLDKQLVADTLEAGLLSAARKKLGPTANIEVKVDIDAGKIGMCVKKKVTTRVHDHATEISLAEAHKVKKDVKCGETLSVQLSIEEFGRNAIQAVKQVLVQRVREAERERIYNDFQRRIGEIIRGTVQQVDRTCIIVKLDKTEGILLIKETMPRDRFRHGEYVRTCVIGVDRSSKGPQVMLSRTHPDFLKGLFASEVPEVADHIVEIKNVAREAGNRSKVCVVSNDAKVDAVGACVGVKGSRVQAVVRELGGERIDIVPWSIDPVVFVTRALSPAKVLEARVLEKEKKTEVVVSDDQLSLAIGKGGQNARLAAKLTGWKIDLMSLSQKEKLLAEEKALRVDVENIESIGPKLADKLIKAGVETAQDIEKHGTKRLLEIQGIGEKTVEKLVTAAGLAIAKARENLMRERARAAQEAKAAEKTASVAKLMAKPEAAGEDEVESAKQVEIDDEPEGGVLQDSGEESVSGKTAEARSEGKVDGEEDEDEDDNDYDDDEHDDDDRDDNKDEKHEGPFSEDDDPSS